jgi:DNA-binding NarL/FixJ family response regulator
MNEQAEIIRTALSAGARSYLLKNTPMEDLVFYIRKAFEGNYFVSPVLHLDVRNGRADYNQNIFIDNKEIVPVLPDELVVLLRLSAEGLTSKEMAEMLKLPVHTIKHRFTRLFKILDANDKAQAIYKAMKMGFLPADKN